jgi:hypothetical protein
MEKSTILDFRLNDEAARDENNGAGRVCDVESARATASETDHWGRCEESFECSTTVVELGQVQFIKGVSDVMI